MKTKSPIPGVLAGMLTFCLTSGVRLFAGTFFSIGNEPGYPGTTVQVPIGMRNSNTLVAAQFDLSYDGARVTSGALVASPRLANHLVRSRQVSPGVLRTVIYSMNNGGIRGSNTPLCTIPFTISPTEYATSGPLTPSDVILARTDATAEAPVNLSSGEVFVGPVHPREDGTLDFFLGSKAGENYMVQASTDFLSWVNLTNVVAESDFLKLVDVDAAKYPHRFYRWALYAALGQVVSASVSSNGNINLQITGLTGRSYQVQVSTDLVTWQTLGTTVATDGTATFTDPTAPALRQRFYRLRSQ